MELVDHQENDYDRHILSGDASAVFSPLFLSASWLPSGEQLSFETCFCVVLLLLHT